MSDYFSDWLEVIKSVNITSHPCGVWVPVHASQQVQFAASCEIVRWRIRFSVSIYGQPSIEFQEESVSNPSIDTSVTWALLGNPPSRHWETIYLTPGGWKWPAYSYSLQDIYDLPEMVGSIDQNGLFTAPPVIDVGFPPPLIAAGRTRQNGVPQTGASLVLAYAVPVIRDHPERIYPNPLKSLAYTNRLITFQPN